LWLGRLLWLLSSLVCLLSLLLSFFVALRLCVSFFFPLPLFPMRRRDFLHPRQLAQATGSLLGALEEISTLPVPPPEPPPAEEVALLRLGTRAMATRFEMVVPFDTDNAVEAATAAFDLLAELEDQLTVYRPTSEVCRLNRLAPTRPVRVEEGLFELLSLSARISAETAGTFDITAGSLIKAWGFFRGPRRVPPEGERRSLLERVGMDKVVLRPDQRSVSYRCRGLEINLGSIGKGYALDRLGRLLREVWNLPAVLLHGGSSSVYATGNPHPRGSAESEAHPGWPVRIRHPWEADRSLATVFLRDRSLGTSAATFQYLEYQGRKLGHTLDPRTGWPAEGLASVSVVAGSAAEADALSTAFYVGGLELARDYCAAHPGIGALILPEGADELVVLGLKPEEYTLSTAPVSVEPLERDPWHESDS
jgi:thiamine biosynthesis lipoprotein